MHDCLPDQPVINVIVTFQARMTVMTVRQLRPRTFSKNLASINQTKNRHIICWSTYITVQSTVCVARKPGQKWRPKSTAQPVILVSVSSGLLTALFAFFKMTV